jgi:hypothetical protein
LNSTSTAGATSKLGAGSVPAFGLLTSVPPVDRDHLPGDGHDPNAHLANVLQELGVINSRLVSAMARLRSANAC